MSGRRLRLDLSDFVIDAGAKRWIFLSDQKFSTVSDLIDQLKDEYTQLTKEDTVHIFMDGDFVIPSWESIEIFQSGDILKIKKINGTNKRERSSSASGVLEKEPSSKKRKIELTVKNNKSNKERSFAVPKQISHNQFKEKASSLGQSNSNRKSSSSSSSSDEDEGSSNPASKMKNNARISQNIKNKETTISTKTITKDASSSSSSSSSEDENNTNVNATRSKNKETTISTKMTTRDSGSSSSSSSSEEENDTDVNGTRTKNKKEATISTKMSTKDSSSSSSSSSSEEENNKRTVAPSQEVGLSLGKNKQQNLSLRNVITGEPKRKRKRKNKNKNKLPHDQLPIFDSSITIQTACPAQRPEEAKTNSHLRFDECDKSNDAFTPEEISQLYTQSVPFVYNSNGQANSKNDPTPKIASINNDEEKIKDAPLASSKQVASSSQSNKLSESCEDILLDHLDKKRSSNISVVTNTVSKTMFTPRVLSLNELKKNSKTKTAKTTETSNQVANSNDCPQFSALLSCKGTVFNKNGCSPINDAIKDYSAYHLVNDSGPRVGDIIAFKVLEIGENYTPQISEYKEGKVVECDGTNFVTFELIKNVKTKKMGKFEIEENPEADDKVQTFNWCDLVEPRLLFP